MLGQLRQAIAPSLYPVTVDWGLEAEGENCQVPRVVPAIFHGSRLSLFRIFAGDVKVGRKVVLKAGNTEQELELDKEPRLSGELLHKMFARRMIQELEEEPHLGDSERDLIKDMSLKYNIMSSFTSFIAVDERSEKKEEVGEMMVRRVDNMIPHGFGGSTGFGAAPAGSTGFGGFGATPAQPATSIGLFGSQPANKPAFGFGTSAPAATPGFGGGFGATSTAGIVT